MVKQETRPHRCCARCGVLPSGQGEECRSTGSYHGLAIYTTHYWINWDPNGPFEDTSNHNDPFDGPQLSEEPE